MIDNEIKKALECLHKRILKSKFAEEVTETEIMGLVNSLDLINRLRAENERLKQPASASFLFEKAKLDELSTRVVEFESNLKAKIKAEAYKEFAERVKEKIFPLGMVVDNLLKEMVGDK